MILASVTAMFAAFPAFGSVRRLRRMAHESAHRVEDPDMSPECSFVGGVRTLRGSAGWPLARLEFFRWGIRLGGTIAPVRWTIGTWEARYEDLAEVRLISSVRPGWRFAVKGSTEAVLFMKLTRREEIIDQLEQHGIAVDGVAMSLSEAGGMYRS